MGGAVEAVLLAIVVLFSLAILAVCVYGVVSPTGYIGFAKKTFAALGVWGASTLRVLLAVSLWVVADQSVTPIVFRALALMSGLAALAVPIIGAARIEQLIQWVAEQPAWVVRSTCALGIGLGAFLLWSCSAVLGAA